MFQIRFKAQIARSQHSMPIRALSRAIVVQALGFKCISYDAEFASRRAADCQRRHPASSGTACGAVCRPRQYPNTSSDRTFRCFGWDSSPTLQRTLSLRWSPRDLPSDAAADAADASAADDAHVPCCNAVFQAGHEDLCIPVPAVLLR